MAEAILTFANIIEAEDITEQVVPIPEWGGSVKVRSISYRKMEKLKGKVSSKQGDDGEVDMEGTDFEKELLVAGMVDPIIDIDQAELLMDKSASAVIKIVSAIMKNSKATDKSVTEEEKSLPTRPE